MARVERAAGGFRVLQKSEDLNVLPEVEERAGEPIDVGLAFMIEKGGWKAAPPAEAKEVGQRVGRRIGELVDS
jgi:hypothetical protein